MYFITLDDFYEKVQTIPPRDRQTELEWAGQMKASDPAAREKLIQSYLPMVAAVVRRSSARTQSLALVYECLHALEREVDRFDFFQEGETFVHRLSWALRQAVTRHIVESG